MRRALAIPGAIGGLLVAAGLWACGNDPVGSLSAGETCSASSQCGPGLVCNFGVEPPVCAEHLDVEPPAADGGVDGGAGDAGAADAALPDAAPPDAAPDAMM